jgi:hypothetical protein
MRTALKLILVVSAIFAAFVSGAQTNSFYNAGEFTEELAPTYSSPNFLDHHVGQTYGWSLESEYWMARYTGTGLEIGAYDYRRQFDHISVMQDFRFVPFANSPFWKRFTIETKTGAETFLYDGSKGVLIGVGDCFQITKNVRAEADLSLHFDTKTQDNEQRFRIGLQWIF